MRSRKDEEDRDFFEPAIEALTQSVGETPLMIGSRQIAESLARPGTFGEKTLGGAIGSFVPTLVSDIGEAVDPLQRETRGQGVLGPMEKRIPFLR